MLTAETKRRIQSARDILVGQLPLNMYLHHFSNPVIHEYDTLTNKNRWDDKADVILANPPFMTPKGGIRPHDRFAISANRSEVLFVDYIAEHLNPAGRAGIIVPEGIIFQSQNAYKELRRMLVDGFLWAVVSLPAGVFNPYSGVKTSILLLDRTRAKQNDEVLFVKVANDGFGLGAQRREIELNDFPEALKIIQRWKRDHKVTDGKLAHAVSRKRILESPDIILSGDRYRAVAVRGKGNWPMVKLREVCETVLNGCWGDEVGENDVECFAIKVSDVNTDGLISYEDATPRSVKKADFERNALQTGDILVVKSSGSATRVVSGKCAPFKNTDGRKYVPVNFILTLRINKSVALPELIYHFVSSQYARQHVLGIVAGATYPNLKKDEYLEFVIPLPPLAEQERLVAELENCRRIIESARQILAHYKPTFLLNSKWPQRPLNQVCEQITDGTHLTPPLANKGIPMLDAVNINEEFQIDDSSPRKFISKETDAALAKRCKPKSGDILISSRGTIGKIAIVREGQDFNIMGNIILLRPNQALLASHYLAVQLLHLRESIESNAHGVAQKGLYLSTVRDFTISVPPLAEQRALVEELETERALVEANRELAVRFEQKLQTKLSEIWGA